MQRTHGVILGGLVAAFFAFRRWTSTESGRYKWDRARLQSSGSDLDRSARRTFRLSGRESSGPVSRSVRRSSAR